MSSLVICEGIFGFCAFFSDTKEGLEKAKSTLQARIDHFVESDCKEDVVDNLHVVRCEEGENVMEDEGELVLSVFQDKDGTFQIKLHSE